MARRIRQRRWPKSAASTSRRHARRSSTTSPTRSSCSKACRPKTIAKRRRSTWKGSPRCGKNGRRKVEEVEEVEKVGEVKEATTGETSNFFHLFDFFYFFYFGYLVYLSMTIFLRAVIRRTSGTFRSVVSMRRSFSFSRESRFIDTATGVFGFFDSATTML